MISDDYDLFLARLKSVFNRLKGNPELLQEYDKIFKAQLEEGIIEKVPVNEYSLPNCHFISHHCVIRSDKTTSKVRIVFDGSACSRENSRSLNDKFDVGDIDMPSIFDILIRFRSHAIALTADIEKAFLRIGVKEADRNALRFLWFEDIHAKMPQVIQMRITRVPFGLTCSSAILGATIQHHIALFSGTHPEAVQILQRLYADDLSCRVDSSPQAFTLYQYCKYIMSQGAFNLRKWNSNDKDVLDRINNAEEGSQDRHPPDNTPTVQDDDQTYSKFSVGPPVTDDTCKILGVNWNMHTDQFYFDLRHVIAAAASLPPTKRSVLKIAAKIFDPQGCLCLFVVNMKILFSRFICHKSGMG